LKHSINGYLNLFLSLSGRLSHLLLDRGQLLLIELLKLHQDLKTKDETLGQSLTVATESEKFENKV
jgi:hypothetical protein